MSRSRNRRNPTVILPNRSEQLQEIRADALAASNPYQLADAERNNLVIVLNTLDYIVKESKELSKREGKARTVFFIPGDKTKHAPIHLEAFPAGDGGEKIMLGSLVDPFIKGFQDLKELHSSYVKEFCGKLSGLCIDARTRLAFDYALTTKGIPSFTECMKVVSDKIKEKEEEEEEQLQSYFDYFNHIYITFWGKPYTKDNTKPGYSEHDGIFDETSFPLIARFLSDLGLKPDSSILNTLQKSKCVLADSWTLNFALFHPAFFDELGLKDRSQEDIIADPKNTTLPYLQTEYDDRLNDLKITKEYGFDLSSEKRFQIFINLLNRCGHRMFFEILKKQPVFDSINNKQKKFLLALCIQRLKKCKSNPRFIADTLNACLNEKESIVFIATELKNILFVKELLSLFPKEYPLHPSSPLQKAIDNKSWNIIEAFAEAIIDKPFNNPYAYTCYRLALVAAIKNKKIDTICKLLTVIPSSCIIESELIITALESNDIPLCDTILKNIKQQTSPTTRREDYPQKLADKKIKNSTLAWALQQEKFTSLIPKMENDLLIKAIVECGDIERITIFISNPIIKIGSVDEVLSKIDAKPNADEIRKLFSSTEMKLRIAHDKTHFCNNYQGAVSIMSDIYSEKTDSSPFDFANILKFDELNPYQRKLLSTQFLTKNFTLISDRKDRALFETLEKYVSDETITAEMRAVFPKPIVATTTVVVTATTTAAAANPASFFRQRARASHKRANPPEVLADDDNVQAPAAKKARPRSKAKRA